MVANVDWFFISHRMCIAEKAKLNGWDVYVACQDSGRSNEIIEKGLNFINITFSRSGTNVLEELKTIKKFYRLYKDLRPDIVHHITLKPVIYGSVVSKITKIGATVNAISGLGYNFTGDRKGVTQKIMIRLMKFGFSQKKVSIIFQNQDDCMEVKSLGVVNDKNKINFIKGSGVDLLKFNQSEFINTGKIKVLFPARMLWDKGVAELRKATEILKNKYENKVLFIICGLADTENKAGVTESYLKEWEEKGYIEWVGYKKNMVSLYKNSDIVVLPSYREGMPKSLIEACAIGRPIVTTTAIGCRECVDESVNGYKVPVKSTIELAEAIEKLVLNKELRINMGLASRKKAELEFSQEKVINIHLDIYNELYKK
jgi:glycosyltransferase involved in cell wall biosynthesis